MDEEIVRTVIRRLRKRRTDYIVQLWCKHDTARWSPEAFEAMRQVLLGRSEDLSPEILHTLQETVPCPEHSPASSATTTNEQPVFCPFCASRLELAQNLSRCPNCARDISAVVDSLRRQKSLVGVHGWLLLFVLGATIFGPLLTLIALLASAEDFAQILKAHPETQVYVVLVVAGRLLIAAASFFVGLKLWSGRPIGLRLAQLFLLGAVLWVGTDQVLINCATYRPLAEGLWAVVAIQGVASAIWLLYLGISKRVTLTYGRQTTQALGA